MPRLLLVDDNQSIHKIAETLLTATDIELTCASSGAEALERIALSAPFDVALLDTSMQGMDGWTLLDRIRRNGPTALMPIAMMAGVLDSVDPETVRKAPIQGFLKKPIELRDLADRVRTLLATHVEPPAPEAPEPEAPAAGSGYATLPSIRLEEHPFKTEADLLLLEPGDVLDEPGEVLVEPGEVLAEDEPPFAMATEVPEVSYFQDSVPEEIPFEEASPLVPEPAPPEDAFDPDFEALELEELDLDGLKELPGEPAPMPEEAATAKDVIQDAMAGHADFAPEDAFPAVQQGPDLVTDELPDLGPSLDLPEAGLQEPDLALEAAAPEAVLPDYWADESETLLDLTPVPVPASGALADHADFGLDSFLDQDPGPEPTPSFLPESPDAAMAQVAAVTPPAAPRAEAAFLDLEEAAPAPDLDALAFYPDNTGLLEPFSDDDEDLGAPVPPVPAPVPASAAPQPAAAADPLAAILADPVLMDRLAKAVVARLGDQILREIAWEVMPEMADRLRRP